MKLFNKDFDFIKVANFSENNTVQNEMTNHKLGEKIFVKHISDKSLVSKHTENS